MDPWMAGLREKRQEVGTDIDGDNEVNAQGEILKETEMCITRAEALGELAKCVRCEVQEQERVSRKEKKKKDGMCEEYVWRVERVSM